MSGPAKTHPTSIAAPPLRSDEAERAILGSVFNDSSVFPSVRDGLRVEELFDSRHRIILRSMLRLDALQTPIDLVTVYDELGAELAGAGGQAYLASLADPLNQVAHVAAYIKIVKDKALAREMLANQQLAEQQLYEGCEAARVICARSVETFSNLAAIHGSAPLSWRDKFHRLTELPDGEIDFCIDNFLPRGVTFLGCASPKRRTPAE